MGFIESVRELRKIQSALAKDDPLYEAIQGVSPTLGDTPALDGTYLVYTKDGRFRTAFWGLDEDGATSESIWSFWDTYDPEERPNVLEGVVCWWLLQETTIEFETALPGGFVNALGAYFHIISSPPGSDQ